MMNPWDREHTYREHTYREPGTDSAPSPGGGWLWLVAVIIAVIGLAVMSKHGANSIVAIPIGISLFFMVMFMVSHRRETKRLAWRREWTAMQQQAQGSLPDQPAVYEQPRPSVDLSMRKIFDRFDLKVINKGRDKHWDPKRVAGFLEYARDYVDTQYASALMQNGEKGELERHLEASLERALLQYDIDNPGNEVPF